jgi:hypothetical protein
MNLDQTSPQTGAHGRFNCLRYLISCHLHRHVNGLQRWAGKPIPRKMGYADDTLVMHMQSAMHWDSLATPSAMERRTTDCRPARCPALVRRSSARST